MDQNTKLKAQDYKLLGETREIFMTLDLSMISWIWHQKHEQQQNK